MARIPGAQAHYSGSYSDLEQFLDEREIGLCTDDDVVYIKNTDGDLVPVGIKYYAGSGISITDSTDPENPGKVISCASAVYTPNEGSPVSGALSVAQAQNGNLGVRVGNVSSDLGLLAPSVPENSTGMVLTVGNGGGLQWKSLSLPDVAPSFDSRAPLYVWYAGEVCTYDGELYMFDADHSGEWTGTDAHVVTLTEVIRMIEKPTVVISGSLGCDSYTYTNNSRNAHVDFTSGSVLELYYVSGIIGGPHSVSHVVCFDKTKPLKIRRARIVTPGSLGIGVGGADVQPSPGSYAARLVLQAFYEDEDTSDTYYGTDNYVIKFPNYNEWVDLNFEIDCSSFEWDYYHLRVMSSSTTGGIDSVLCVDDYNLQQIYEGQSFYANIELEIDPDSVYVFQTV